MALPPIDRPAQILIDVASFVPTTALAAADAYRAGEGTTDDLLEEVAGMLGSELSILALLLALSEARSSVLAGAPATDPFLGRGAGEAAEPGAFAYFWNGKDEAGRLEFLEAMRAAFDSAGACFTENHRGRLARLADERDADGGGQ